MARQLGIEFEGAYYHILSRGNNQSNIFHSDEDRQDFLYILADMSERFEIEIEIYALDAAKLSSDRKTSRRAYFYINSRIPSASFHRIYFTSGSRLFKMGYYKACG